MNTTLNEVNTFTNVFKQHLNFVEKAKLSTYDSLYKKIICVGIIDILSKSVNPNEKSNKSRFTGFLKKYSPSELWNKISLTHLIKLLCLTENPEFSELEKYAKLALGTTYSSKEPKASFIDHDFEKVEKLWPKEVKDIKGITLQSLKHINLFYNYRNFIVHELRRPGGLWDDNINHKAPFYYGVPSNNNKYFWKLVYPLGFFYDICTNALANTKKHYLNTNTNPYDIVGNSDYFIDILN